MNAFLWILLIFVLAVVFGVIAVHVWRRYRQLRQEHTEQETPASWRELLKQAVKLEAYEGVLRKPLDFTFRSEKFKQGLKITLELSLILLWAVWIGREYLDMDLQVVPAGREFGSSIQAHHLWTRFQQCGWCALWDGSERGGFPAFVDPLASSLHPAVIATTLAFGVVNGAKVMVIVSLWIAGIAQWWLGRVLKLSWLARMWGVAMVMVGGHLAGRMELGIVSLVLSTAAVSLTLAPAIRLSQTGSKRDTVILAVVLAMMAVAGQGYMQVGFLFMAPAYLILIVRSEVGAKLLWKRYFTAAGLALLLAAPFLVPFLHFFPNFLKDSDPYFTAGQPLPYYLLNLFIDDRDYFYGTTLGRLPYPHMYTMFVGWIPVALALISPWVVRKEDRRPLIFLAVGAGIILCIGSTQPLQWVQKVLPGVTALRFITMAGGLAVPAIIALAAYALDKLLELGWPRLTLIFSGENIPRYKGLSLNLVLLIPLAIAVERGYDFSQLWLYTERMGDGVYQLLEGLETPGLQWVQPPFGEHFYIEPAVRMGLKLSPGIMTWRWEDRDFPPAVLEANRSGPPPGPVKQVTILDGIPVYAREGETYAAVIDEGTQQPCVAVGAGGQITVKCDTALPGMLVVKEYMYSGWKAWLDGEQVSLIGDQWLEVSAPTGEHTYEFRYQPWDVPFGIFLLFVGIALSVWVCFRKPANA
jgi:hypothetical protein